MTSLYCIRDAGGVRRYRTYLSREAAERQIDREAGPGCRAPFDVVEFMQVTPTMRAADDLLAACRKIWNAEPGTYPAAFQAVHDAIVRATTS